MVLAIAHNRELHTTLFAQEHKPKAYQYPSPPLAMREVAHLNFLRGFEYPDCAIVNDSDPETEQRRREAKRTRLRISSGAVLNQRWIGVGA